MKLLPILFTSLILSSHIYGQVVSGKIVNTLNNNPIEYASIGVIDMPIGTTTDENGLFNLDVKNLSVEKKVRVSMIGYKSKTFSIEELLNNNITIDLEERFYEISEVVISPSGNKRKVGTTRFSRRKGVCGWGGTGFGAGNEIGTKIDLGEKPVKLKSVHLRVYRQSFDSTLFRLHIRNLVNDLPGDHLHQDNIYLSVSEESGWVEFDISSYNIVLNSEIVLSIEWLNVFGVNQDRMVRMNRKSSHRTAVVLFNIRANEGLLYSRWGSEAEWTLNKKQSPSFYLTVIE